MMIMNEQNHEYKLELWCKCHEELFRTIYFSDKETAYGFVKGMNTFDIAIYRKIDDEWYIDKLE